MMVLYYKVDDIDIFPNRSQKKGASRGGFTLNLSTHNLTTKTCAVLGRALATDRAFHDIKLNDCMLPEEGKY